MLPNITTLENVTIAAEVYAPQYSSVGVGTDLGVGCEVFSMDNTGVSPAMGQPDLNKPIIISDGRTHNIYLNSSTMLGDCNYVTELCMFLGSVQGGVVTFHLGSGCDDSFTVSISPIIVAMQELIATGRTKVRCLAYGFCSVPETMIWTYGAEREVGEYGTLRFGGGEWIQRMEKVFQPYINTYMNHCKSIGVLSEEQVNDIIDKQSEIMYIQEDGQLKAV